MKTKKLTQEEIDFHKSNHKSYNPAVYCGTYGKYNNGSIEGMWIDLTSFVDYDEFIEFCKRLHADEEDPELMFQDYEYFPDAWYSESCISEEMFDKIIEYANLDGDMQEGFCEYLECFNSDADIQEFSNAIVGQYDSMEEYAEEMIDERCDIPEDLRGYIDLEKYAETLEYDGYELCGPYVILR